MRWMWVLVACSAPTAAPRGNLANPTADVTSDSTLALFEPAGGECVLRRVDPVAGTSAELARFPGACFGVQIAWRADLRRAAVWFRPGNVHAAGFGAAGVPAPGHPDEAPEIVERHYEVDLATHAVVPLTPPAEAADEIAYGSDGALLAFVERDLPDAHTTKVTVEGRVLDFTDLADGMPAAAIVYRRDGGGWTITSVVATTTGWDLALGWSASPEAAGIGPRSRALLAPHADTHEIAAPAVKTVLDRIAASKPDDDGWNEIATAHGSIYVWMFNAEFTHTTGRIAWRTADGTVRLLPELGFTAGELVAIATSGRYVLVAGSNTGAYPRLYDLVERKRVFASDTARAVTLWPATPSSASRR